MFESAELGHRVDKEAYDAQVPTLREGLLLAQLKLGQERRFAVAIVLGGLDGGGRWETVGLLNDWLDPRFIRTHAVTRSSDEERERPPEYKFWRRLPPKGRIALFHGSWYSEGLEAAGRGELKRARLDQLWGRVQRFEEMLVREGVLIVKFWFHLSKARQRQRLKELSSDPRTRWRVTAADWQRHKHYQRTLEVAEHTLRKTSTPGAPWLVVEATDSRYRNLTVGKLLLEALQQRLGSPEAPSSEIVLPPDLAHDSVSLLGTLDLSLRLGEEAYRERLALLQGRLNRLSYHKKLKKRSVILVFEGMDAAGKGGSIRRLAEAMDPTHYQIHSIAAPTEEERAQPYLWRFWRKLPRAFEFAIFDRSWYGRVLVERVEGLCRTSDWMRGYGEINDFEANLTRHGAIVLKFWLHISQEEQLQRFKEREATPFKRHKITGDDWRNREKWPLYEQAILEMLDRTSTRGAPWVLIANEDKRFGRVRLLEELCDRLEAALE